MYSECTIASEAIDFTKPWSDMTVSDSTKHLYLSPDIDNHNKPLQIFFNTQCFKINLPPPPLLT